ncbi:hypothetical protein I4U23_013852 [Adineta vaga]|nr:hypothetical protein I4U23_013852 [Adineta vaga]
MSKPVNTTDYASLDVYIKDSNNQQKLEFMKHMVTEVEKTKRLLAVEETKQIQARRKSNLLIYDVTREFS